jgi:hypothetical protein
MQKDSFGLALLLNILDPTGSIFEFAIPCTSLRYSCNVLEKEYGERPGHCLREKCPPGRAEPQPRVPREPSAPRLLQSRTPAHVPPGHTPDPRLSYT